MTKMESAAATQAGAQTDSFPPAPEAEEQSLFQSENQQVGWSAEIWKAIHRAVHDETMRVGIGPKFLPRRRVHPNTQAIDSGMISSTVIDSGSVATLTVDEGSTVRINEIWTEFALTRQQVEETKRAKRPEDTTAVSLARRTASYLALAQDMVILQGINAYSTAFFSTNVGVRQGTQPLDGGLLSLTGGPYSSPNPPIVVGPLTGGSAGPPPGVTWGENTLAAVSQASAILASSGNPGPFALVLNTVPYADLFAPVGVGSLVVTADRVAPLVKAGLYATAAAPPNPDANLNPSLNPSDASFFGVFLSVGGGAVDLTVALNPTTAFLQVDSFQNWRFRVVERFALRVLDPSAIQVLEFIPG
jgi:uncharacterized linocin/CFP29 family protein